MEINPLNNLRNEIINNLYSNDATNYPLLLIADEILKISDSIDVYLGIKKVSKDESRKTTEIPKGMKKVPDFFSSSLLGSSLLGSSSQNSIFSYQKSIDDFHSKFAKVHKIIKNTKEPLQSLKQKLDQDHPFYLNISTCVVSLVIKEVVSSINNYKAPSPGSWDYDGRIVIRHDMVYGEIVSECYRAMKAMSGFDMTKECKEYYTKNKNTLYSILESFIK